MLKLKIRSSLPIKVKKTLKKLLFYKKEIDK
jgi:hypothetical protein